MRYLHTMLRVTDVDASMDFFCNKLGLVQQRRVDVEQGRFSLIFLSPPDQPDAQVELTWNWDPEDYTVAATSAIWPMRSMTSMPSARN